LVVIADWPEPIQKLYSSLNASGLDTETFAVCLLDGQPANILATVVCRIQVDDPGWVTIPRHWTLQPIPRNDGESLRDSMVSKSDPSWWPPQSDSVEYFASASRLAGDEGDPYIAAHDTTSSRAYIHYFFNF
jgi:hypothetical protein